MAVPNLNAQTMPLHQQLDHHHGIDSCIQNDCDRSTSTTFTGATSYSTTTESPELVFDHHEETCNACSSCADVCCTNYEVCCETCTSKMQYFDKKEQHQRKEQKLQQKQQHCTTEFLESRECRNPSSRSNASTFSLFSPGKTSSSLPRPNKSENANTKGNTNIPITRCQLRRHNNPQDGIWLLCGKSVYDVTNYLQYHPGGEKSILRKSGGVVDCTRDMSFHSPQALKLMKKFKIGYLVPCPGSEEFIQQQQQKNNRQNGNFFLGVKRNSNNSDKSDFLFDQGGDQCVIS